MFVTPHEKDRWRSILAHYDHLPEKLAPLGEMMRAFADAPALDAVTVAASHFTPWFTTALSYREVGDAPMVSVQYWPEASRFRVCRRRVDGIPYDEKWCEQPEAIATVKHLCRLMRATAAEPSAVETAAAIYGGSLRGGAPGG